MRLLFEIDTKDYKAGGTVFSRPSARAVVIRDGRVAMVHSLKYGYYKFPGGGIEAGENGAEAAIRETLEETGLIVKPETVSEYGYVHRVSKGEKADIFLQDNFYYLCETEPAPVAPQLEAYEEEGRFVLEFVEPSAVICQNREIAGNNQYHTMLEREARVLELLTEEGYFERRGT